MKKTKKLGKKRRSIITTEELKYSIIYPLISPVSFENLLNAIEIGNIKPTGDTLKNDIEKTTQTINAIETFEAKKGKHRQDYRSFKQEDIDDLSDIMANTPLYAFTRFLEYPNLLHSPVSIGKLKKKKENKYDPSELCDKTSLRHLRIAAAFSAKTCKTTDDFIRGHLACGIFEYIQQLILDDKKRVSRCGNPKCGKWFRKKMIDNLACCKRCSEAYWREYKGGRADKAAYMKDWRRKQKLPQE